MRYDVTHVGDSEDEVGGEIARQLFWRAAFEAVEERLETSIFAEVVNIPQQP